MKFAHYFLLIIFIFFLEHCKMDTSGCEKNCEAQLSICLLAAINSESSAVPLLCYQVCDTCKDNCRLKTSSGSGANRGSGTRTGGGSSSSGSGGSSGGTGHGGGGAHSVYEDFTF
ncbi:hypothetical protein B1J93_19850 [Leptospira kirschneri serovar Pomona]|uniref:Uncharacterized protein n=1 Tax=Leptospira kirschneri serovar Pomona TaxID=561005 RepID=A0A1T1DGV1_9LEPT|nr:hypothetical protein [Leptospira kirschneri]OOV40116.1 hypothetical protein B1J93_19850 [Leptospira kirschneri serovar Pomona]WBF96082.1 hypothetical protein LIX31_15545 [Leptospira kirschneri]